MREFVLSLAAWLVVVALYYAPTLGGPYQADDFGQIAILTTPDGRPNVAEALDVFVRPIPERAEWRFHRPLWHASFLLDVGPFRIDPRASRCLNLLIHCAGVALVAWILRRRGAALVPSHLAAGVLALGPASPQVVSWIVARCDSMAVTFGLAAIAARLVMAEASGGRRARWRVASLFALVAAVWSKESGYAFVPALVVLAFVDTRAAGLVRRAIGAWDVALVGAALFLLRADIVGDTVGGYGGAFRSSMSFSDHVDKAVLAMFPAGLAPKPLGAAAAVAILALVGAALARARGRGREAALVGIALLLATLATTASIPVTDWSSSDTSRLLHQPAAAWSLVLGAGFSAAWSHAGTARWRSAIAVVGTACVVLATVAGRPLVLGHAEAGRLGWGLVAALRDAILEPGRPVLWLKGIPDSHGPGLIGRSLTPAALAPAIVPIPAPTDVHLSSDRESFLAAGMSFDSLAMVLDGRGAIREWDPATLRFVPIRGPVHVHGRVRRLAIDDSPASARFAVDGVPFEIAASDEALDVLATIEERGGIATIVLERDATPGSAALVRDVTLRMPTLWVEPGGPGDRGTLVVRGEPGSRIALLLGDRPGWTPIGEPGTSMIGTPKTVRVGGIDPSGRLEIPLDALLQRRALRARYVQVVTAAPSGGGTISERIDLGEPPAAGE